MEIISFEIRGSGVDFKKARLGGEVSVGHWGGHENRYASIRCEAANVLLPGGKQVRYMTEQDHAGIVCSGAGIGLLR